jgi:hypothetical protein
VKAVTVTEDRPTKIKVFQLTEEELDAVCHVVAAVGNTYFPHHEESRKLHLAWILLDEALEDEGNKAYEYTAEPNIAGVGGINWKLVEESDRER